MPGYILAHIPGHPLAVNAAGDVLEHRAVLYDAIGPGPHPCEWCGAALDWYLRLSRNGPRPKDALTVDHLDNNTRNNARENLVPACHACNIRRSDHHNPSHIREGELFVVRAHGRTRAAPRVCEECSADFLIAISELRSHGNAGRFCSTACRMRHTQRAKLDGVPVIVLGGRRYRAVPRVCEWCGKDFLATAQNVKKGFGRFCSKVCTGKATNARRYGKG